MSAAINVFCAGAVRPALTMLVTGFEKETGHRLQFTYGAAGSLKIRILEGESADALILNRPALEQLERAGRLLGGTILDLGRVGVGIAVRNNAPLCDVSTPDALRGTLLAAASISYGNPAMGDSSGIHFANVLERLGIAEQVSRKAVLAPSGLAVAELVRQGKVELGATQASLIPACDGITLAGLLPPSLQHVTTYSAAVTADAASAEAARRFVSYLTAPLAKLKFGKAGFDQAS